MTGFVVLSHFQTTPLLEAQKRGDGYANTSLDLNLTTVKALLKSDHVCFPNGEALSWDAIEAINGAENSCFIVEKGKASKIQTFSRLTNRACSLMPTRAAPTMLLSGIPMHRIKGTDPHCDTLEKIKTIKPVTGPVLDTATGLGYTAIEAAKTAGSVFTIELDPAVLEIARMNPWSRALFEDPNITRRIGDSYDVIEELEAEAFMRIIHDPPVFSLAGHLYSREFYAELYRVLRRGGRVFHYIGDPESRSGRTITRGVMRRLQEAGFSRVARHPRAFGVVAFK